MQFTIDTGLFYDTLIMMLRGETVKFSKRIAKERRAEECQLLAEVKNAQDKFDETKSHDDLVNVEIAQNNLEKARESRIKGLIVRSRANWCEQGERSTKYFLSLEKRNATRKSIQYLNVNDKVIANKHEILKIFTKHFALKYTAPDNLRNAKDYLDSLMLTKLSNEQKQQLDAPLTLTELTSAIMKMKKENPLALMDLPPRFSNVFGPT